MLTLQHFLFIL